MASATFEFSHLNLPSSAQSLRETRGGSTQTRHRPPGGQKSPGKVPSAANASAAGIELRDLKVELEGDLDLHTFLGLGDGNAGFSTIQATVHIESDADDEAIEALHRKVVSTSPVGHTLSRSIPLDVTLA